MPDDMMAAAFAQAQEQPDGIVPGESFEAYLASSWRPPGASADAALEPRVSKSSLWTAHTRSPRHARVEKEESNAMKLGTAIHCAILEPDQLTVRFVRGPEDRRGNKWKDFVEGCEKAGKLPLTEADYDAGLLIRDRLQKEPLIKRIAGAGTQREISCYYTDPETGLKCRARPDAYVADMNLIVDLKSTTDARLDPFGRVFGALGYHVQAAKYPRGWQLATGADVEPAFLFVALERAEPFEFVIYEPDADTIAEGRVILRKALDQWARCVETGEWPGYERKPQIFSMRKWDFRETQPIGDAA